MRAYRVAARDARSVKVAKLLRVLNHITGVDLLVGIGVGVADVGAGLGGILRARVWKALLV